MTAPYSPPPAGGPGGPGQYQPAGGQPWQGAPQGQPGAPQWQAPPVAPAAPRKPVDLGKTLGLAVAGLGVLNLIWGFLPFEGESSGGGESLSIYGSGASWVPILLFVGGLLAVSSALPKKQSLGFAAAAISVGGGLASLFVLLSDDFVRLSGGDNVSLRVGAILLVIFGLLQAVVAVVAWLSEVGIVKSSGPRPQQAPPAGWGYPPAGGPAQPHPGQAPQGHPGMPPMNPSSGPMPPTQ